ncbi:MAG: ankyrin repeat domain-containing protein [Gammaproteobacteria bacterium]|nr:ankyrin repeat domain-containing protein [Gammaproteobacteria bacterium]
MIYIASVLKVIFRYIVRFGIVFCISLPVVGGDQLSISDLTPNINITVTTDYGVKYTGKYMAPDDTLPEEFKNHILIDTKNGIRGIDRDTIKYINYSQLAENKIDIPARVSIASSQKNSQSEFASSQTDASIMKIHIAIKNDDVDTINDLIKDGLSPDLILRHGMSALKYATELNHIKSAVKLLESGADPNIVDDSSSRHRYAISAAIYNGNLLLVDHLIEAGANINIKDKGDDSVLHTALSMNNHNKNAETDIATMKILEYLLSNGANINAIDKDGNTLLHKAVWSNNFKQIMDYLVNLGLDINKANNWNKTPYDEYILKKQYEGKQATQALGSYLKSISARSGYAITSNDLLCDQAKKGMINEILKVDSIELAKIQCRNNEGILTSAIHVFFNHNKDVFIQSIKKFSSAVIAKNQHGRSLLHLSVLEQDLTLTEKLLEAGFNVNGKDSFGATPLHYASAINMSLSKLLISHGATLDSTDINYDTPLYHAIRSGNSEIAEKLIHSGVNIDGVTNEFAYQDRTLTGLAANYGELDVYELLLEKNARIKSDPVKQEKLLHTNIDLLALNMVQSNNAKINNAVQKELRSLSGFASVSVALAPDNKKYNLDVYVPTKHVKSISSKINGIIIFLKPYKNAKPSKQYAKILEEKGYIWIGLGMYQHEQKITRSNSKIYIDSIIEIANNALSSVTDKIFLGGFSEGGFAACGYYFYIPSHLSGVLGMSGCTSPGYPLLRSHGFTNRPVALTTSDFDHNLSVIQDYYSLQSHGFNKVQLFQKAGGYHEMLSAGGFNNVLEFLEN